MCNFDVWEEQCADVRRGRVWWSLVGRRRVVYGLVIFWLHGSNSVVKMGSGES